jgi:NTP pyrophosphatase (non-canonical NTP hydrolase)
VKIATMIVETRELNIKQGWRSGNNTFGDYIALIISELGEAVDAYRSHKLDWYTNTDGKPDDVASEFADVWIRTLDMADVLQIPFPPAWKTLEKFGRVSPPAHIETFCDHIAWLARAVTFLGGNLENKLLEYRGPELRMFISKLLYVCDYYGVNLEAEYTRKMAFNRTRPFQHGGKVL